MRRLLSLDLDDDGGAVGGYEALPFGVLIFVVGTLVVANAWAVVDAKMSVTAAAREAARAYVEAPTSTAATTLATVQARAAIAAQQSAPRGVRVSVEGGFRRCDRVRATVSIDVPALRVPWVGGLLPIRVTSTASEIVDPLRSGLQGEATCLAR